MIAIGGDGTILYSSKQFHGDYIPPIIGFSSVSSTLLILIKGSLGFLCNFKFIDHEKVLNRIIFSDFLGDQLSDPALDLRMRLKVNIGDESKRVRKVFKGVSYDQYEESEIKDYHIINEVVIDRGPSPYSIQVEIYIDDEFFTTAIGDG